MLLYLSFVMNTLEKFPGAATALASTCYPSPSPTTSPTCTHHLASLYISVFSLSLSLSLWLELWVYLFGFIEFYFYFYILFYFWNWIQFFAMKWFNLIRRSWKLKDWNLKFDDLGWDWSWNFVCLFVAIETRGSEGEARSCSHG